MKKILVIEDTPGIREEIIATLGFEGFDAIGAENGKAGVQLAQQHAPELIICDIMMPELDGYGVLRELRQHPATAAVPFIFLTAKAEKADLRHGMELGADDYLTKPFLASELIAAVNSRLEKSAALVRQSEKKLEELRSSIGWALPHELRTPLTGILASADFLIDADGSLGREEFMQLLTNIRNNARRLHRLIENYLAYVRIELLLIDHQKVNECRQRRCDFTKEIIDAQATLLAQAAQREANLVLETEAAAAHVSDENLTKIVTELVDNAFKFSNPGTTVFVRSAANEALFTLAISNHGRGLTPDQISRIGAYVQFDRNVFEQQGSGMGLIIAKRLAELHGGQLTISSIPDEETTVYVTLPN
jgi:signal transduction histidine kinase